MSFDMLIGRFLMMIPALALAGNLAQKKSVPPSPGTFPVNTPLFATLLVGVVLIIGALTFFPAMSLDRFLNTCCCRLGRFSNRTHTASKRNSNRQERGKTDRHG
ncbi:MAG: potassium-transporting ATPase subunit KdpA [Terracidiphilus sp.]